MITHTENIRIGKVTIKLSENKGSIFIVSFELFETKSPELNFYAKNYPFPAPGSFSMHE